MITFYIIITRQPVNTLFPITIIIKFIYLIYLTCVFSYYLMEGESTEYITDGTIILTGQDYLDWSGSNDEAYQIVANQLNLSIITV